MSAALGPLHAGDKVALLSVSGPPSEGQLRRGVELLQGWGLDPVVYPSATTRHPTAQYLAGPDQVRADDLVAAWCDPEVAAVFCVRGGYGSVRVLDLLDAERMRAARPKPLYGSSDVTALHEWFAAELGVPTWHTPMVATGDLLDDEVATGHLRAAVLDDWRGWTYANPAAEVLVPGSVTGPLRGGNLSLLAMTLGARAGDFRPRDGAVVLLEDVDEDTYKLDGYLLALLRAGWFDDVAGLVLGSWRGCVLDEVRDLVVELLGPMGVPMVWEFGFGHGPASLCVPLGVRARLDAVELPTLTLL